MVSNAHQVDYDELLGQQELRQFYQQLGAYDDGYQYYYDVPIKVSEILFDTPMINALKENGGEDKVDSVRAIAGDKTVGKLERMAKTLKDYKEGKTPPTIDVSVSGKNQQQGYHIIIGRHRVVGAVLNGLKEIDANIDGGKEV